MKNALIGFALLFLATGTLCAQDIHFSQSYNSPLTLNPALTGSMNGLYRVSAIYRNQWWAVNSASPTNPVYYTYSGGFDAVLFPKKTDPNRFGIGLMFFGDDAGNGALTTQSAMLSLAYHKSIDRYGANNLSIGLQAGYVQKRIFIYDLVFESQLEDLGFNTNIYHGENAHTGKPIGYVDFNIGAMWRSAPSDGFKYYIGFSAYHIAKPNESFLQDTENRLDHRYVASLGAEANLSKYLVLAPSVLYMRQSNAQQINAGAALIYRTSDQLSIFGGAWYRVNDAVIGMAGFDYSGFKTTISYDINTSGLKAATSTQGSLELSVIYVIGNDVRRKGHDGFCPSF